MIRSLEAPRPDEDPGTVVETRGTQKTRLYGNRPGPLKKSFHGHRSPSTFLFPSVPFRDICHLTVDPSTFFDAEGKKEIFLHLPQLLTGIPLPPSTLRGRTFKVGPVGGATWGPETQERRDSVEEHRRGEDDENTAQSKTDRERKSDERTGKREKCGIRLLGTPM